MKEYKPLKPASGDHLSGSGAVNDDMEKSGTAPQRQTGPSVTEVKTLRPDRAMLTENDTRKSRGRLTRETLGKLGKTLEAYYDDVRKQGVPERFRQLLQQMDDRREERPNVERKDNDTQDKEVH